MNPAFAIGRAFVANSFGGLWIYWLGPLLGGACAALCHEYIFNEQVRHLFPVSTLVLRFTEGYHRIRDEADDGPGGESGAAAASQAVQPGAAGHRNTLLLTVRYIS